MRLVDPRHLLQFHEIIRTGSFTRAAAGLGITQPALTRNMKLMEGRLGFELIVRSRQGIVPTTLGLRILEEANAVVLAERRISALTNNLKRGYGTELKIGCTPTMSFHALPQPVAEFARDNQGIRLDIRQGHKGLLSDWLRSRAVDLVLGPPSIADGLPGTNIAPIFESPVVILASRNHPLAGRARITTSDLENARWALHQPGTSIREATDILLRQIGVSDTVQANELPSSMILSLLRMGDHLAVMPRYVTTGVGAGLVGDLTQIAVDTPPVQLAHAAIWSENGAGSTKEITMFVDHLRGALASLNAL